MEINQKSETKYNLCSANSAQTKLCYSTNIPFLFCDDLFGRQLMRQPGVNVNNAAHTYGNRIE